MTSELHSFNSPTILLIILRDAHFNFSDVIPGPGDVIGSSASGAERPIWVSRRYWGDEMSSCIEIYCLRHLGGDQYLNCLQNYCPDAVVRVLPRRQLAYDVPPPPPQAPSTAAMLMTSSSFDGSSSNDDDDEGHVISVTCSSTRRLHCIGGALCYVTSGSARKPAISASVSRCALTECVGSPGFARCLQLACC